MSQKNSPDIVKQSTQDIFKLNHTLSSFPNQILLTSPQINSSLSNSHGKFLTHQQKIQATYNFQSLFRKKSPIYAFHKNKKKIITKNLKQQCIKNDNHEKESKNVKKGHWTPEQNRKYHLFLQLHHKNFILKHLRRTDKIFKTMSGFIGTREAQQCRSHHQKMQKKFKNFYQIIVKLRTEFYGNYNTQSVKTKLQENGYIKESQDLLLEQSILRSIENTNQSRQSESNSDKEDKKQMQNDEDLINMEENHEDSFQQKDGEESKKQGHLFFGQNYESQLNYKLY